MIYELCYIFCYIFFLYFLTDFSVHDARTKNPIIFYIGNMSVFLFVWYFVLCIICTVRIYGCNVYVWLGPAVTLSGRVELLPVFILNYIPTVFLSCLLLINIILCSLCFYPDLAWHFVSHEVGGFVLWPVRAWAFSGATSTNSLKSLRIFFKYMGSYMRFWDFFKAGHVILIGPCVRSFGSLFSLKRLYTRLIHFREYI